MDDYIDRVEFGIVLRRLAAWLRIGHKAAKNVAYDADQVVREIRAAAVAMKSSFDHVVDYRAEGEIHDKEIRSILGLVYELRMLGLLDQSASRLTSSERLQMLPPDLRRRALLVANCIERDYVAYQAERDVAPIVEMATAKGLMLEFVQRFPGVGCWLTVAEYDQPA